MAIKLDSISIETKGFTHVLRGTKSPEISSMSVSRKKDRTYTSTNFTLTDETWEVHVRLFPGDNFFEVTGTDSTTTQTTAPIYVELPLKDHVKNIVPIYGYLDRVGAKFGLTRLPGEKNWNFKNRILELLRRKVDSTFKGVQEGIALELGMVADRAAMTVKVRLSTDLNPISDNVTLRVRPTNIAVTADRLYISEEVHVIDPGFRSFELASYPRGVEDVVIHSSAGVKIHNFEYKVDTRLKTVTFLDHRWENQWVKVNYHFENRTSHRDVTITSLAASLNAITADGNTLLEAIVKGDGELKARGIPYDPQIEVTAVGVDLTNFRVQVTPLSDEDYFESLFTNGTAEGTKLEKYFSLLNKKASQTWGNVTLDKSSWISNAEKISRTILPPEISAKTGYYKCSNVLDTTRYTQQDFEGYAGLCPIHYHAGHTLTLVGTNAYNSGYESGLSVQLTAVQQDRRID